MAEQTLDPRDFRRALAQFPTGVTVITTVDGQGSPVGVTASSFNSVSLDPPLILWSVDKRAFSAEIFKASTHFAVNVLADDQIPLSNRFAGRGEDKFKDVAWTAGLGGCPLFDGVAARFECRTWNVYDGGDHLIVVGEVAAYIHDADRAPLVFARGAYAVTSTHPGLAVA